MNEQQLKEYLVKLAQEYGSKWNEYEDSVREQSEAEMAAMPEFADAEEQFAWFKENKPTDWHEELSKWVGPLFDRYCTDKKRVYGGKNVRSFGFPAKFNGIGSPVETSVDLKNKNRAEVYFKTKTAFQDEYLFVLLRKAGQWKIDSYKGRRFGDEKWDNRIL